MAKPELKAECVRLRVEDRLSLREIQDKTGASKGSLSRWLKECHLTDEEIAERRSRQNRHRPPKKDRGEESDLNRIVRAHNLGSVQVGKVSETAVLLRLLAHGFNPFGSVFDGDTTDWLVETADGVKKVQVKTTKNHKHGLPCVDLRHGHSHKGGSKRYQEGDFDIIVGFDLFTDTAYVWSWDEVAHLSTTVTVCPEAEERWDKFIGM